MVIMCDTKGCPGQCRLRADGRVPHGWYQITTRDKTVFLCSPECFFGWAQQETDRYDSVFFRRPNPVGLIG